MNRPVYGMLAVAMLGTVLGVLPSTEATAAVPAPKHYESTTASTSSSPKTAIVFCPAGTAVLGGGGQILGGHGQVALVAAHPVYDPYLSPAFQRSFRVTAAEDESGYSRTWSLKASVYCTAQTATEIVSTTSALDSVPSKTATAECPEGKLVVGAGGFVSVGTTPNPMADAQVNLVSFRPNDDLTEVTARGTEPGGALLDDEYGGVWTVTAVAVCGYAYAFDGLELRQITVVSALDADEPELNTAVTCSHGKRLVAAGADLADDTANTYLHWAIRTNLADTRVSAYAYLNPEKGKSTSPDLTAYAICTDG